VYIKRPHSGIEPQCGNFLLQVARMAKVAGMAAALGVFFGLEVVNFDLFVFLLFLCFVLHITFQLFVVSVVSVAPNSN